jgi:hypothetical protein
MIADEPDFIRLADLGVEAVEGDACAPSTDVLVGSLRTPEGSSIKKSLFTNLRAVDWRDVNLETLLSRRSLKSHCHRIAAIMRLPRRQVARVSSGAPRSLTVRLNGDRNDKTTPWLCNRLMPDHAGNRLGWRWLSAQAQGSPALRGSQSPRAPMRSSRRARQGALPLPRRTFDRSPNGRRQGAHRRGPAATLGDGPPTFKETEEII